MRKDKAATQKPKAKYRVRNWTTYNAGLINRGNITMWIDDDVLANVPNTEPTLWSGRPPLLFASAHDVRDQIDGDGLHVEFSGAGPAHPHRTYAREVKQRVIRETLEERPIGFSAGPVSGMPFDAFRSATESCRGPRASSSGRMGQIEQENGSREEHLQVMTEALRALREPI
jgi:hypothetical protein